MDDLACEVAGILSKLSDLIGKLSSLADTARHGKSLEAMVNLMVVLQQDFPSVASHVHHGVLEATENRAAGYPEVSRLMQISLQKISGTEHSKLQCADSATLAHLWRAACTLESCDPWSLSIMMDEDVLPKYPWVDLLVNHGIEDGKCLTLVKVPIPNVLTASDDGSA